MGKLLHYATSKESLRAAWQSIRANGTRSSLKETRDAVELFDRSAEYNIDNLQRLLRRGTFTFAPQTGVLKKKSSGGVRGIVMAPVQNRVVERAVLNALQNKVPYVQQVINTPTSVGGVPDRSVPHGLAIIHREFAAGKKFFVRADISGFFDGIPRQAVLDKIAQTVEDKEFLAVLSAATTVTLSNELALGEDRKAFPTNDEGVAQGSPLSPLFGNILLHDFDERMTGRGVVCVRFIDDFLILSEKLAHVEKTFRNAKALLSALNLTCHDPFDVNTPPDKAAKGAIEKGFIFLGYDIRPGILQPSAKARKKLLSSIDEHIERGRESISAVIDASNSFERRQRYVQTLDLLDRVIKGWGNSFAYGNATETSRQLDRVIDEKILVFRRWYQKRLHQADSTTRRRAVGVCLLTDIERKRLEDVPFRLERVRKLRSSASVIEISTDGSLIDAGRRSGKEKGFGGWSVIFHADGAEMCGSAQEVTNNCMELTAVVEALKKTPAGALVRIRTDSQYVYRCAEKADIIRSNSDLWKEFQLLRSARRVNIVWVKGHAGDLFNERADKVAKREALRAKRSITAHSSSKAGIFPAAQK